jgi:hypothetical protein
VDQFPGYIVIVDISGYTEFVKMHAPLWSMRSR